MSNVLLYPILTEKVVSLIEKENKIVFAVDMKANKTQIKREFEERYGVKVIKVNTIIGPNGVKKAYIKLSPEYSALELATKLGIL